MDGYRVKITEPSDNDLRDIYRYISSQLKSPTTAANMVQTIKEAIAELKTSARLYPFVMDERLAAMGYRTRRIKNYTAFYVIHEDKNIVVIDRILDCRRNWQNIL